MPTIEPRPKHLPARRSLWPHLGSILLASASLAACDAGDLPATAAVESTASALAESESVIVGYLMPDLNASIDRIKPEMLAGFEVTLVGTGRTTVSDSDGYFTIEGVSSKATHVLRIKKPGYLQRDVSFTVSSPSTIRIGSARNPVELWPGDLTLDGVINMSDVMVAAKSFNTAQGSSGFDAASDINGDGAINMSDIILLAGRFNTTSGSYSAATVAIEPKSECYGALGLWCQGADVPIVSALVPPAKRYKGMNGRPRIPVCVGSILHDNCCYHDPKAGVSCEATNFVAISPLGYWDESADPCMAAWRKSFLNVRDVGRLNFLQPPVGIITQLVKMGTVGCWEQTFFEDDRNTLVQGRQSGILDRDGNVIAVNHSNATGVPSELKTTYTWQETPSTKKLAAPLWTPIDPFDKEFCDSGRVVTLDGVTACAPAVGQANTVVSYLEGKEETILNIPVFLKNGTPFMPLRQFAEEFGRKVTWDQASGQIKIDGDVFSCTSGQCYTENNVTYATAQSLACFIGMRVGWPQTPNGVDWNIYFVRRSRALSGVGYLGC